MLSASSSVVGKTLERVNHKIRVAICRWVYANHGTVEWKPRRRWADARVHPDIESLVTYYDQELDPKRAQTIAEHLAQCCHCQREVAQISDERERLIILSGYRRIDVLPVTTVLETIRARVGKSGVEAKAENRLVRQLLPLGPALVYWIAQAPLLGFVIAVFLLMNLNTFICVELSSRAVSGALPLLFLPLTIAGMLPAYVAGRHLARWFALQTGRGQFPLHEFRPYGKQRCASV